MNVQYKKGVLELCVIALLGRKDCYGFELASTVSETIQMSEGTVYPLLRRLKEDTLLETYIQESSEGPPRKYYRLTQSGRERYTQMVEEWREFCNSVDKIIEGSEKK